EYENHACKQPRLNSSGDVLLNNEAGKENAEWDERNPEASAAIDQHKKNLLGSHISVGRSSHSRRQRTPGPQLRQSAGGQKLAAVTTAARGPRALGRSTPGNIRRSEPRRPAWKTRRPDPGRAFRSGSGPWAARAGSPATVPS